MIGTYLHGPLLPKNVWLADRLIELALDVELDPLDDALEDAAHASARRAAGRLTGSRGPEPGLAARRLPQVVALHQRRRLVAHDHQLGDPLAGRDRERLVAVGVQQQHPHLAAVARVDETGRVDKRYAVPRARPERGSTRPGVALGDGHRDARAHRGALPRPQLGGLGGEQVEARVVVVGARGRRGGGGEPPETQLHQWRPLSAKRSKRAAATAGTRARTITPSGVSSRSTSPASSCSSDSEPPSP